MDDNQFGVLMQAHFSHKTPLEDGLALKTKMRIQENAEKRNNLLLCLIQIGFWFMTLAIGAFVIITVGNSVIIVISIVGYLAVINIAGILLTLASSSGSIGAKRRIEAHG